MSDAQLRALERGDDPDAYLAALVRSGITPPCEDCGLSSVYRDHRDERWVCGRCSGILCEMCADTHSNFDCTRGRRGGAAPDGPSQPHASVNPHYRTLYKQPFTGV